MSKNKLSNLKPIIDKYGTQFFLNVKIIKMGNKFPINAMYNFFIYTKPEILIFNSYDYEIARGGLEFQNPINSKAKIADILVKEEYKRHRLGLYLLKEMENIAITAGVREIWGEINSGNLATYNNFFKKYGYIFKPYSDSVKNNSTILGKIHKYL
jgi:hypothetical protein